MEVSEALLKRRTIRKFSQIPVSTKQLKSLVNYARLAPFAANVQGLRYKIITDRELGDKIFNNIKWAGYLPKGTPATDERPPAYIAVIGDTSVKDSFETDAGAAVMSIILGALDYGLGACWLGAIRRKNISEFLGLEPKHSLLYMIALGYPAQESKECPYKNNPKYFYDENGVLNVPKLSLDDIII